VSGGGLAGKALGRLPPRVDARTLRFAKYARELVAPPPAQDWDCALPLRTPLYANDRIGDCAIVSAVSLAQTWSAQNGAHFNPSVTDVVADYSAVSGYRPTVEYAGFTTNETDRGCDMLSVLTRWRKLGIADRKILAFVKIDHDDIEQIKTAIRLFGGVYVGASLPRTAGSDAPWVGRAGKGDASIGSWGGHAMSCATYDRFGPWFRTWGRRQRASWLWWLDYVDEVYACLSADWIARDGFAPNGFDLSALRSDLQAIN